MVELSAAPLAGSEQTGSIGIHDLSPFCVGGYFDISVQITCLTTFRVINFDILLQTQHLLPSLLPPLLPELLLI